MGSIEDHRTTPLSFPLKGEGGERAEYLRAAPETGRPFFWTWLSTKSSPLSGMVWKAVDSSLRAIA